MGIVKCLLYGLTGKTIFGQAGSNSVTVSFHPDDVCGTAVHDATEIGQIVQKVKSMTHQNQVNIVAHSKGGLDARLYLAKSGTHDVANLIMLGSK